MKENQENWISKFLILRALGLISGIKKSAHFTQIKICLFRILFLNYELGAITKKQNSLLTTTLLGKSLNAVRTKLTRS